MVAALGGRLVRRGPGRCGFPHGLVGAFVGEAQAHSHQRDRAPHPGGEGIAEYEKRPDHAGRYRYIVKLREKYRPGAANDFE